MSEQKHTQGPWDAERDDDRETYFIGHRRTKIGQRLIAEVGFGYDEPTESEQHANARLIAAAPKLLEALRDLSKAYVRALKSGRETIIELGGDCDPVETMERGDPYLLAARDAIAKAEGTS